MGPVPVAAASSILSPAADITQPFSQLCAPQERTSATSVACVSTNSNAMIM